MDNQEKLATLGTQDTRRKQTKQNTQHNMCWTSNCVVLLTVYLMGGTELDFFSSEFVTS